MPVRKLQPDAGPTLVMPTLGIPTAGPAVELTDIESVRQFMQKSLSDKLQDEDLEILILQASEGIERHCNRQFIREDAQTKSFEFIVNTGLDLVDLKPYEYRVLKEVVLDPDLTPVTLSAYQYRPWPYPSRDGTFFGLRLAETPEPVLTTSFKRSAPSLPYQTRRIDVKADWGTASVPKELQHWANVTVEAWAHLRREGGSPNEAQFGEGPLPIGYDLPLPVRWGLRRWQRPLADA